MAQQKFNRKQWRDFYSNANDNWSLGSEEENEVAEFVGLTSSSELLLPEDAGNDVPPAIASHNQQYWENSSDTQLSGGSDDPVSANSESDLDANTVRDSPSLKEDLALWLQEERITRQSAIRLLKLLKRYHPELPADPRTLSSAEKISTLDKCGGKYYYLGIMAAIKNIMSSQTLSPDEPIELYINVDGLPLFKSSSKQFWPILVSANNQTPF